MWANKESFFATTQCASGRIMRVERGNSMAIRTATCRMNHWRCQRMSALIRMTFARCTSRGCKTFCVNDLFDSGKQREGRSYGIRQQADRRVARWALHGGGDCWGKWPFEAAYQGHIGTSAGRRTDRAFGL